MDRKGFKRMEGFLTKACQKNNQWLPSGNFFHKLIFLKNILEIISRIKKENHPYSLTIRSFKGLVLQDYTVESARLLFFNEDIFVLDQYRHGIFLRKASIFSEHFRQTKLFEVLLQCHCFSIFLIDIGQ